MAELTAPTALTGTSPNLGEENRATTFCPPKLGGRAKRRGSVKKPITPNNSYWHSFFCYAEKSPLFPKGDLGDMSIPFTSKATSFC